MLPRHRPPPRRLQRLKLLGPDIPPRTRRCATPFIDSIAAMTLFPRLPALANVANRRRRPRRRRRRTPLLVVFFYFLKMREAALRTPPTPTRTSWHYTAMIFFPLCLLKKQQRMEEKSNLLHALASRFCMSGAITCGVLGTAEGRKRKQQAFYYPLR